MESMESDSSAYCEPNCLNSWRARYSKTQSKEESRKEEWRKGRKKRECKYIRYIQAYIYSPALSTKSSVISRAVINGSKDYSKCLVSEAKSSGSPALP